MKILVSGTTGLVGKALAASLTGNGHEVWSLVRRAPGEREVRWSVAGGVAEPSVLEGFDAVVHLAGEGIASGRWNAARKERIERSRTEGTANLVRALAACKAKPGVFVCASAIGFYGDRGDELLDETSASGTGFLADVCRRWEEEAARAADAGMRAVSIRIGIVLAKDGGALAKMLLPFKIGAGGKLGSGRQYMSWIALPDLVGVIRHAIETESLSGPVNAVAPEPCTNSEFTAVLGRVLSRPTFLPAPAFALRLALGEMADALLLSSARVRPVVLARSGFVPRHPELEGALRAVLGR